MSDCRSLRLPRGGSGLAWCWVPTIAFAATACGWPLRSAVQVERHDALAPLRSFEDVRAVDGYPDAAFQASFDEAIAAFARTPVPADGRRDFDMLVLSSGGVNGSFGAGILTGWSARGDRPDFRVVTGVSVGALMAPFVFAGQRYDAKLEALFRRIEPADLHREKDVLPAVLWDESLADNGPLRANIEKHVDEDLMRAVAARHAEGRRCYVGSTNLDVGHFCVWDLGAIASRGTPAALQLMREVLTASSAIPVVYPPVRFGHGDRDELHVDGAVIRPLFIPQNVFDGYASAERAQLRWDDVDATLYVVNNGALRPCPVEVQRDTLSIATRTVTMMSYTMATEHVLHLYMLARAWGAEFRFHTVPDGLELDVAAFTPEDTNRLFLLGRGLMERAEPWEPTPPGYVVHNDLTRIAPQAPPVPADPGAQAGADLEARVQRLEGELGAQLRELREELRALRTELRSR